MQKWSSEDFLIKLVRELCAVLQKKTAVQVALMSLDCFGITWSTTTTATTTTAIPSSPLSIGNKLANE